MDILSKFVKPTCPVQLHLKIFVDYCFVLDSMDWLQQRLNYDKQLHGEEKHDYAGSKYSVKFWTILIFSGTRTNTWTTC